ncbi:MAG: hypothetical protein KBG12_05095 [Syntrophobacterales bacterium]|nr:hypothetical protein [Syntrophobacterales bacterium]
MDEKKISSWTRSRPHHRDEAFVDNNQFLEVFIVSPRGSISAPARH